MLKVLSNVCELIQEIPDHHLVNILKLKRPSLHMDALLGQQKHKRGIFNHVICLVARNFVFTSVLLAQCRSLASHQYI